MHWTELGRVIYKEALLLGDFTLKSGKKSDRYLDKYKFEAHPEIMIPLAMELDKIAALDSEVLGGMEMGGISIATMLSVHTGLPMAQIRKTVQLHGTKHLVEGVDVNGKNLLIVEDVVTTGGQIIEVLKEIRLLGATVENAICVINRGQDAGINLLRAHGVALVSLFTLEQLQQISA